MMTILNEKFRPQRFEDVIGLDETIPKMVNESMPHFLFVGDAGTGKTTTAKIIIKELGADFLMLNSSEERGIDTIREKVKNFATTMSTNRKIKIIFLDEADGLTILAQDSLRNLMEEYAKNARFVLTANYENKIIAPIKSRCTRITFKRPSKEMLLKRLITIAGEEKIVDKDNAFEKISENSNGDFRTAINMLQYYSANGMVRNDMTDMDDILNETIELLQNKKFTDIRKLVIEKVTDHVDFVKKFMEKMLVSNHNTTIKKRVVNECSECLFRFNFVADPEIQIANMMLNVMELL